MIRLLAVLAMFLAAAMVVSLPAQAEHGEDAQAGDQPVESFEVRNYDKTAKALSVWRIVAHHPDRSKPVSFAVPNDLAGLAEKLDAGDHVNLTFAPPPTTQPATQPAAQAAKPPLIASISYTWSPVSTRTRVIFVIMSIIILLAALFTPLTTGTDNRRSKSKFQLVIWFGLVILSYLVVVALRWRHCGCEFIGGVSIPNNLLMLAGLSGLTFAAAKGIVVQKVDDYNRGKDVKDDKAKEGENLGDKDKKDKRALVAPPQATPAIKPRISDLFLEESKFSLGDAQAVIITLIAAVTYVAIMWCFLERIECRLHVTLPDVDSTLLALFGLGQGTYLAKKYVGQPTVPG